MSPPRPRAVGGRGRYPRRARDVSGPVSFLNPTAARVDPPPRRTATAVGDEGGPPNAKPERGGDEYNHDNEDGRQQQQLKQQQQQKQKQTDPATSTAGGARHEATAAATPGDDGRGGGDGGSEVYEDDSAGFYHLWRSRDNRKGRHAIVVGGGRAAAAAVSHPRPTDSLAQSLRGVWRMVVRYPVWDVSYDVAVVFTLGSVIWVINSFFVWLPLQAPQTEFDGESSMGGGVTAFVGATVFELGSVLLMLEAVNENRTQCFGWALEEAWEEVAAEAAAHAAGPPKKQHQRLLTLRPARDACSHPHPEKRALLGTAKRGGDDDDAAATTTTSASGSDDDRRPADPARSWEWWPTWSELRTHYFREVGFLACLSQFIGATIFWIAGFTGLPPIYDGLSTPAANGVYWLPQVVGGTGFIISSWLFMLETQPRWYIPAPRVLGWHMGFWNLVGALGFTICGALGFASGSDAAAYGSTLATFIGSWAFLIGSVIQWYESLDKYPITIGETGK